MRRSVQKHKGLYALAYTASPYLVVLDQNFVSISITAPTWSIGSVSFSPDGTKLLVVGSGIVKVYNTSTWAVSTISVTAYFADWGADNDTFWYSNTAKHLCKYTISTSSNVEYTTVTLPDNAYGGTGDKCIVERNTAGTMIAVGPGNQNILIFATSNGSLITTLPTLSARGYRGYWSPDGLKIAVPGYSQFKVFRVDTWADITPGSSPTQCVTCSWNQNSTAIFVPSENFSLYKITVNGYSLSIAGSYSLTTYGRNCFLTLNESRILVNTYGYSPYWVPFMNPNMETTTTMPGSLPVIALNDVAKLLKI